MQNNIDTNAKGIFWNALNKPTLSERCRDIGKIIDESNNKILHKNFPSIIQEIFGGNGVIGWKFRFFGQKASALEVNLLKDFLGCHGPIMRMVLRLQAESVLFLYEFLSSMLPPSLNFANKDMGLLSQQDFRHFQYSNVSTNSNGQQRVLVTAFEFYFYNFAYNIYAPQITLPNQTTFKSLPEDSLYYILIDDYLAYFLPIDGSSFPIIQVQNVNQTAAVRSPQWGSYRGNMLKKSPTRPTTSLGGNQTEMWCSETLLTILKEFWIGRYCSSINVDSKSVATPSEDVVGAVRRLIKHMHYFMNSNKASLSHSQHLNDTIMEKFKQGVMYNGLEPRLFEFLTHCFINWPLNNSFRIVLEAWLSYIQPWRYPNASHKGKSSELRLSTDREIANLWYPFISQNLVFYTKMLYDSLARFLRMDLSLPTSSLLLFRVTKIFGQPNLIAMIEEAEDAQFGRERISNYQMQSPGSYISPGMVTDLTSNFSSAILSSEEFKIMVKQLLIVCQQALGTVKKHSQPQKDDDWSTKFLNLVGLGSLFSITITNTSLKKSDQYLNDSINLLSSLFDVEIPLLDSSTILNNTQNSMGVDAPECDIDEEGNIHLSPQGKNDIINNVKKLPVYPRCHPDLQPIRSFENAWLVRHLYRASTSLNDSYSPQITELCDGRGAIGVVARYYLQPKFYFHQSYKDLPEKTNLKPRLSLRFLANYRNILYVFLFFALCRFYEHGFVSSIFYFIIVGFLFLLCQVMMFD